MATTKISFENKTLGQSNALPESKKLTYQNTNEIKSVVNNNADEIDANATILNALDGTNIELIKGGGVYVDDAIVGLQTDVNANSTTLNALDGTNIEVIKGGGLYIDDAIVSLQDTKVDLGGDIGGTVTNPAINSGAISNAKLSNIPTNRIKGRASSGNGVVEDLTVPQTKSMLSIDNVDNTSDLNKPLSTATANALNLIDFDLTSLDNAKISKNVGTTYTTNALTTVTQSEYDGLTPDASTIYFII